MWKPLPNAVKNWHANLPSQANEQGHDKEYGVLLRGGWQSGGGLSGLELVGDGEFGDIGGGGVGVADHVGPGGAAVAEVVAGDGPD